ncbi:DUF7114 family protein [Halomarina oriensis]|uniref:Polyprenyl synthetase n=1 Tax=Halomarina oriensis TaxID=671145 RepID=A0A6B0GK97_9EURY|nr:hypothetical protein [Halomarina oriensis]MWG34237.1 hypothetical protein [Halomarina oriensis]
MEDAAAVRRAARASVDDIEPERLRADLRAVIDDGSMVPGVVTVHVARAYDVEGDAVYDHAAGVQLIYDGLGLTRRLAAQEPWLTDDRETGDMHVLAANALVARGFYLLARTEAADAAVEVVQAFGRDETERRERGTDAPTLEADVLDLAVVAGAAVGGTAPTADLRALAGELAESLAAPFPPVRALDDHDVTERVRRDTGAFADL